MAKIESLTPEQEQQMIAFREEWRARGLSTERVDKEKTKEAITEMYKLIGKKPPIFIFCPSLIFAKFQIAYSMEVLPLIFKEKANLRANLRANLGDNLWDNLRANLRANLWDNLWDNLGDNLRANLRANLWDNLRANLGDNLGANLRANLWDNLGDNLRANLWDNLGDNLRANLWDNLWDNLKKVAAESNDFWGSMDAYWIAFYEYPEKFLGVEYKIDQSKKLKIWSDLAKSCSWFWCYENYCFVADRPASIFMNEGKRLHNISSAAITWTDGYKIHYVNGREIQKKYFDAISNKTFTVEDFLKEPNEEQKSVCIAMMQEKYGDEYLVTFFKEYLKEVDTYVDKKSTEYLEGTTGGMNIGVYTLFKGEINEQDIAYVRCYCPSTDRMFFLGVDDGHNNAKDAIASLYRVPAKLKGHIKSISRQGERFSTILTDKGKEILSSLSEKEVANTAGLDGNEYFSLMQYEF